jgi:hypothetical protein
VARLPGVRAMKRLLLAWSFGASVGLLVGFTYGIAIRDHWRQP